MSSSTEPGGRAVRARVLVFPRREILDPQGKAIHNALSRLDFAGVEEVRAGKAFDIHLRGEDEADLKRQLEEMSQRLLSNPIMEDFQIEILPEGGR